MTALFNRRETIVSAGPSGPDADHVPLLLDAARGAEGTLRGHVSRSNPMWKALEGASVVAIFRGPDLYVTPSWYPSKNEHGKVVPTWNYIAVHAYGPVEFFDDSARLLDVVTRLTRLHEADRPEPWAVTDAPPRFVEAQLRGIVGVRLPIVRLDAKSKMSQNRNEADRAGVAAGLAASERASDRAVAALIPS